MKDKTGTRIGVAAAVKLYFTVVPSNIFQAIYHRIHSFFTLYAPWTWIVLVMIIAATVITIFRRIFRFQIRISKK